MKNIHEIQVTVEKMVRLLRFAGIFDWATALDVTSKEMSVDVDAAAKKILAMYGGMGSLNDIVLYKNGQPLVAENIEFDRLRAILFNLCSV